MSEDLKSLMQTQLFENVTARTEKAKGNKGKYRIVVTFQQRIWPPLKSFRVVDGSGRGGILAIPTEQVERVMNEYKKGGSKPTDMSVLALMRNTVEGWYAVRPCQTSPFLCVSDRGSGQGLVPSRRTCVC